MRSGASGGGGAWPGASGGSSGPSGQESLQRQPALESEVEPPKLVCLFPPPSLSHLQDPPWLSGPCWREEPWKETGNLECKRGSRKTRWSPPGAVSKDGGLSVRSLRGLHGAEWAGEPQVVPNPSKPEGGFPIGLAFLLSPPPHLSWTHPRWRVPRRTESLAGRAEGPPRVEDQAWGPRRLPGWVGNLRGFLCDPLMAEDPSSCQADMSFLTPICVPSKPSGTVSTRNLPQLSHLVPSHTPSGSLAVEDFTSL